MFSCPVPHSSHDRIPLVYGGGGRLLNRMIEEIFLPAFGTGAAEGLHDSVVLDCVGTNAVNRKLAFTTDSFVVNPLFFPGGDIGSLSVHGTVNDLSMSGARPLYLSAGFIIEEGLEWAVLDRVARSMGEAARKAGVRIVTGDTKIVEKGKGDGIFINTSGIGVLEHDLVIHPRSIRPGDAVLLSGDIGRHGMTLMTLREELDISSGLTSDSAALNGSVAALLNAKVPVHCLRDVTRGGLSTTINEVAEAAGLTVTLEEMDIPVREDVAAACSLLGLDVLQVACEGRYLAIVPDEFAERTLTVMRSVPESSGASRIGTVSEARVAPVLLRGPWGNSRILSMPSGAQLPRIC